MSPVRVPHECDAAAERELYENAPAKGVGDVVVPEGEVSLGSQMSFCRAVNERAPRALSRLCEGIARWITRGVKTEMAASCTCAQLVRPQSEPAKLCARAHGWYRGIQGANSPACP